MEKKILNKTYRSLAVAAMSVALTACNADFLDTQPSDRVGTDLVWSTYNMADAVVNGAYERFYWEHQGECADWQNFDAATDVCDLDANWGGYDWARGRCNASYWGFNDWWKRLYEEIYRTSNVINNLDKCEAMAASERARDIAECKFLRAWAYYRANVLWRGVPLYTEPVEYGEDTKPRSSADEIWAQIVKDCSEAIAEQNLPDKYAPSDRNYGRVTKACAYYLRGQVYLWLKDWDKAANDFRAITTMGFQLFPDYKNMFKAANERNDEYIFQYQYTDEEGMGSLLGRTHGNRNTYTADGFGCWNNLIPNPYFVDSYEYADGKPFNMDEVFPGYSKMDPKARSVYFLRDGLDPNAANDKLKAGYQQMVTYGADMSQYDKDGNLKNWWAAEDKAKYDERTKVLADWFSKQEALPGLFVNGQKTLGENIGDNGGLQVAYRAFENRIKQEPLSTIDGFTPAQRFYLAYARLWASNITPEFLARAVNSDVHSPHIFRVNAALPMIDSWYDAFNIQPTDKMFIPKEKRALVW